MAPPFNNNVVENPRNPFDPRIYDQFDQRLPFDSPAGQDGSLGKLGGSDITLGDDEPINVGSGARGGITQTDRDSIRRLFDDMAEVNPLEEEVDFPPDLERELTTVTKARPTTSDEINQAQMQKMALAGKMLGHCAEKIAGYAPRPGEPLVGSWSGQCQKTKYNSGRVRFEVSATSQGLDQNLSSQNRSISTSLNGNNRGGATALPVGELLYRVTGDPNIKGSMAAGPDGVAQLQLQAPEKIHKKSQYSSLEGFLTDVPQAGTGRIQFPGINKYGIGGKKGCAANVHLDQSRSLVPEKYIEGMKKAGQCFRKALVLMSPLMDRMFRNMDPALAQILQSRMLGINGQ